MVINSSHLYKLIVKLINQSGTKSSFTKIANRLYLSDASANRLRAGYVSSQDKQAWWPNHSAWFCNALTNCPMSRLCVQKKQPFPDVTKTREELWQNISIQLYKQMKETASPNLKRFYQNKLKQCTIGEKYEPLTFESHVFNQLMMFYKTSNLTVSQLDAVLCNVLTNCQNTSEVLLLRTASEKFRYLITKCCANKGIDLEKENSKDLLAQLSNPDDLCNLINSFTNDTVYHMFKYPKLEFDDVLIYMNNPSFNLKLTNEYLAKTIGFCTSKENLLPYAEELCTIALKSYPDDENLLGHAIQTALLSGNPDVASEYVKTADKLSEISDTFLLKSLMNYYSSMLLIYSNRKYGSSKKKLLQYADLYINRQPYDEKPLFSIAQDFLAHTKITDAIHFLEHVIHISNGCPGCCCMLIKILLNSGKTSLYIAKQVIDISQKGLSIPFDIGLTNMAYLYHKSADMKLYLYQLNQIPANYNITPNTIYNDYKNAYLSYKLSGYTIDTEDKSIRRRQLHKIKIACLGCVSKLGRVNNNKFHLAKLLLYCV